MLYKTDIKIYCATYFGYFLNIFWYFLQRITGQLLFIFQEYVNMYILEVLKMYRSLFPTYMKVIFTAKLQLM